jgi:hypothetical protein
MILKAWGNWALFQKLLAVLREIGDRHGGLSIANIATRWALDHSFVGAVIIGRTIICLRSGDLFGFLQAPVWEFPSILMTTIVFLVSG